MAKVLVNDTSLQGIANSIRNKNGTQEKYKPSEMPQAILDIPSGTDTSDANATAGDILINKTAYVKGSKVTGNIPNNGTLSITPAITSQSIPTGYTSGGTVSAVTSSIDNNIQANNIKSGVSILGIIGNVIELNGQTKNITPSTSAQTITPDTGYNGITQANVSAVTSSIDANIIPENIKKDVTILGVIGTHEGGGGSSVKIKDATRLFASLIPTNARLLQHKEIIENLIDVTNNTSCEAMFANNTNSGAVSLDVSGFDTSNVTTFKEMFAYGSFNDINITNLVKSSATSLNSMFRGLSCTGLANLSFNNLNWNTSNVTNFGSMFYQTGQLQTVDVSALDMSSGTDLSYMFYADTNLTSIDFGNNTPLPTTLYAMFNGCTILTDIDISKFNLANVPNNTNRIAAIIKNCPALTLNSLKSVLTALATATHVTSASYKKLSYVGFSSEQATAVANTAEWTALSNAGWTTGY